MTNDDLDALGNFYRKIDPPPPAPDQASHSVADNLWLRATWAWAAVMAVLLVLHFLVIDQACSDRSLVALCWLGGFVAASYVGAWGFGLMVLAALRLLVQPAR